MLGDQPAVGQVQPLLGVGAERLEHLLLEAQVLEALAQRRARVQERLLGAADRRLGGALRGDRGHVLLARRAQPRVHRLQLRPQLRDDLHVAVAVVVELVGHDAVEALRLALELVEEPGVHLRREEKPVENVLRHRLRLLDGLADVDLLVAREQLHLPHLVEVHPDRVLHRLAAHPTLVLLGVARLEELLHVVLAENLHPERVEDGQVLVGLDRVDDVLRQDLVQLLPGYVAAVRLAAALDVLHHVVQLGLAQDRHPLHRRQHRLALCILGLGLHRLGHDAGRLDVVLLALGIGHLGRPALDALHLARNLVRIERGRARNHLFLGLGGGKVVAVVVDLRRFRWFQGLRRLRGRGLLRGGWFLRRGLLCRRLRGLAAARLGLLLRRCRLARGFGRRLLCRRPLGRRFSFRHFWSLQYTVHPFSLCQVFGVVYHIRRKGARG